MSNLCRALLLAAPIALLACGPAAVTVTTKVPEACSFAQHATCKSGSVQVETDLPTGTELSRPECDSICLPVNCAGEAKKCTVQLEPQTQTRVVVCEPLGVSGC